MIENIMLSEKPRKGERMDKEVLKLINEIEQKGFNVIKVKSKYKKVPYNSMSEIKKAVSNSYIIEFQVPDKET